MSLEFAPVGFFSSKIGVGEYDSVEVTTTDAEVVVTDSALDARPWPRIAIKIKNTGGTNGLTYYVYGDDVSTFADEELVKSDNVALGAQTVFVVGTSTDPHKHRHLRVKVKSQSAGFATTAKVIITEYQAGVDS